jgi:Beta-lactamase
VVSNGGTITLINGASTLKAEVMGADSATDRCYLRAGGNLRPVPGLREYSSLMVGETVYTIDHRKAWSTRWALDLTLSGHLARWKFRGATSSFLHYHYHVTAPFQLESRRVDAVFADMDMPQHPGAALLVIDHDEIVYGKCYGLAYLETQQPITADSSFYLASISKQFTAMAINAAG